ncbi:hypothetical protein R3W88_006884 [Solanum pinnatisectum]|uniref:DUF4283 domain-containing protein n=1 Tax=Solanum pinnatisectum TaxID=50273 RepID=A0AAV9KGP2_9SOLN|nr:hypothetical protein R3W88_006884 [Solanum pinnatisectum]
MAETDSPQPQAVEERLKKPIYVSISNPLTCTQKSDGKLSLKLKPVIYVHGEPTASFSFSDLESYIQEENLQYALVAEFSYGRPDMINLRKIFTRHFKIKGDCNLGLLDHRHVLETPIALAWISFPSLSTQIFAHEAQFLLASAVGTPLQVDKATTGKSRPSVARVKVEINLLSSLLYRISMFFKDEKIGVIKEVLQKIIYDKFPSYCTTCKHQDGKLGSPKAVVIIKSRQYEAKKGNSTAEKPNQWTLVLHKKKVDSKSSNNHMLHQKNSTQVELDRSIIIIECTQFDVLRNENFGQYEGLHGTAELSIESGNTLDLEKQIEQMGNLKKCCHDDHTNQQALVTHENESIVTKEIDGKEINPNTPAMFILNQGDCNRFE